MCQGNGTFDTSICDIDKTGSLQTKHRWFNYYSEGIRVYSCVYERNQIQFFSAGIKRFLAGTSDGKSGLLPPVEVAFPPYGSIMILGRLKS